MVSEKRNKYQTIAEGTKIRLVAEMVARFGQKRYEHELKRLLHQIWGAYYTTRPDFKKLSEKIKSSLDAPETTREVLKSIMLIHQSTKERLSILNEFYKEIFAITGTPESIIEHGCGLNPLTIPWMNIQEGTKYIGYDIDTQEVDFLNDAIMYLGLANRANVQVKDIYEYNGEYADVIMLLKVVPLLEQQKKGSTENVLRQQNCKHLIVSFPTSSLGGSNVGMVSFYSTNFEDLLKRLKWKYTKLQFQTEIVYSITRTKE